MTVPGPLAGLRILDLTRLLPGGYCTLLLADLGADVVKVEEPGRGDYIRWSPPLVDGTSAAHRALNRGKRSITLNLKAPGGAAVLARLAEGADVLVESFRPGVMDRLGTGHAALSERHPRLVFCAITGFGQDGPYRDLVGHDINSMGFGGALSLGGRSGQDPPIPGVQVGDLGAGGLMAAVGILAALQERERTGRGRFVDIGMLDGVVSWLSIHLGSHLADPATSEAMRPLSGDLACYRLYRTRDGRHVTVGALEPQFWRALCETLGLPDLVNDQLGPPERQAQMAEALQGVFETRDRDGVDGGLSERVRVRGAGERPGRGGGGSAGSAPGDDRGDRGRSGGSGLARQDGRKRDRSGQSGTGARAAHRGGTGRGPDLIGRGGGSASRGGGVRRWTR